MTREEAIAELNTFKVGAKSELGENALDMAIKALEQEPKRGHWIYDYTSADGYRLYHCSECGCYLKPRHSEPLDSFKWCSLCGADMRTSED
jgi:hypothetical protein